MLDLPTDEIDECTFVELDGSYSEGRITSYEWDLDGDGAFDQVDAIGSDGVHATWPSDGDVLTGYDEGRMCSDPYLPCGDPSADCTDCVEYSIALQVTDGVNPPATGMVNIRVQDTEITEDDIVIQGPKDAHQDEEVCFQALINQRCDDIATVQWDFDYENGDFQAQVRGAYPDGAVQCTTFNQGEWQIAVRVIEDDETGDTAPIQTMTIRVEPPVDRIQWREDILQVESRHHFIDPIATSGEVLHISEMRLKNLSDEHPVKGPVYVAFENLDPAGTELSDDLREAGDPLNGLISGDIPYIEMLADDAEIAQLSESDWVTVSWKVYDSGEDRLAFDTKPYVQQSPPIFRSEPIKVATEGKAYRYIVEASDPDGDPIYYDLGNKPAEMVIHPITGIVTWLPDQASAVNSPYSVEVVAKDGHIDPFTLGDSQSIQSYGIEVTEVAVPPRFVSLPETRTAVDQGYTYEIKADDDDGVAGLQIYDLAIPAGAILTNTGGNTETFTWTPAVSGDYLISFVVEDDTGLTDLQAFVLRVVECDSSLVIAAIDDGREAVEGELFQLQLKMAGPPVQATLFYFLDEGPEGLTLSSDGLIEWVPSYTAHGSGQLVRARVSLDSEGLYGCEDTEVFTINVSDRNASPEIISTPPAVSVAEGDLYKYELKAMDPDRDRPLIYSMVSGPEGMKVSPLSGIVTWRPSQTAYVEADDHDGQYVATLRVEDPAGAWDEQEVDISVTQVNVSPQITSRPPPSWAYEGGNFIYAVQAYDPDDPAGTVPLIYDRVLPEDATDYGPPLVDMDFGDQSHQNELHWNPVGSSQGSPYSVAIEVSDGAGAAARQQWNIWVLPPDPDNDQPDITSDPYETFSGYIVIDGAPEYPENCIYTMEFTDSDIDDTHTPSFEITPTPSGGPPTFVMDSGDDRKAILAWTPQAADAEAEGKLYQIKMTVTDSVGSYDEQYLWINVYSAITSNQPPILLDDGPPQVAQVGVEYLYQIQAVDPNGDALTYSLQNKPQGMSVTPDGGLITWTPSEEQIGESWVEFYVTDTYGGGPGLHYNIITSLTGSNRVPEFDSLTVPGLLVGSDPLSLEVKATDPDGDAVVMGLVAAPDGMALSQTGSGLAVLSWTPTIDQLGQNPVTVEARDDQGGVSTFPFYVNVYEQQIITNHPPELISPDPSYTALVGQAYTHTFLLQDDEGDSDFAYLMVLRPSGGGQVGLTDEDELVPSGQGQVALSWTPTADQAGKQHRLKILIYDRPNNMAESAALEYEWIVTVSNGQENHAPRVAVAPSQTATVNEEYVAEVDIFDEDGTTDFGYAFVGRPSNMDDIEDLDGGGLPAGSGKMRITWTPTADQIGTHSVRFSVSDGNAVIEYEYPVTVSVSGDNVGPKLISTPPLTVEAGALYTFNIVVTDENGDTDFGYSVSSEPDTIVWTLEDLDETTPGTARLSGQTTTADVGLVNIELTVLDQFGAGFTATVPLTVYKQGAARNRAPQVTAGLPTSARTSPEEYRHMIYVFDPDGEINFDYQVISPAGMTVNDLDDVTDEDDSMGPGDGKGEIVWSPLAEGTYHVRIEVSDRAENPDQAATFLIDYHVVVSDSGDNEAPVINSTPPKSVVQGRIYSYQISAADPDQPLVYGFEDPNPPALNGMVAGGDTLTWDTASVVSGSYEVIATVTDDRDGVAHQSFTITVKDNESPKITSTPIIRAIEGVEYTYKMNVIDPDDLGAEDLTYSVQVSPATDAGGVFGFADSHDGILSWSAPQQADAGKTFHVVVSVSDSTNPPVTQDFDLQVLSAADGDALPPVIALSLENDTESVQAGTPVNILTSIWDDVRVDDPTIRVTSLDTQTDLLAETALVLDAHGKAETEVTPIAEGRYRVVVAASDPEDHAVSETLTFFTAVGTDVGNPAAAIYSPDSKYRVYGEDRYEQTVIKKPTTLMGIADDDNFYKYTLAYRSLSDPKGAYHIFDEQYQPVNSNPAQGTSGAGVLGTLDPSKMVNGLYEIRLQVFDRAGKVSTVAKTYAIEGDLKIGNLNLTFTDLEIPIGGLPISVSRTYDSRDKSLGEFGYGWQFALTSMKVEQNTVIGEGWNLGNLGGINGWGILPSQNHTVTVTWPNGRVEKFEAECLYNVGYTGGTAQIVDIEFNTYVGTTSTLMPLDKTSGGQYGSYGAKQEDVFYGFGRIEDNDGGTYNPPAYMVRSVDGNEYYFDRVGGGSFKLAAIRDRQGNQISFHDTRIELFTSDGRQEVLVRFNKDTIGRIYKITDRKENAIEYIYDPETGDLVKVIDQAGEATTFRYNNAHDLIEITDPRGLPVARSVYNDDGRLVEMIDAEGYSTRFDYDLENNTQTVTDRLGHATTYVYDQYGNVTSQTDNRGYETLYTYVDSGSGTRKVGTITDALQRQSTRSYFYGTDNLGTETDFNGNTTSYQYNAFNQVRQMTDAQGRTVKFGYDDSGNLISVADANNEPTINSYEFGRLTSTQDAEDNVTSFTYNQAGLVETETDAEGNETAYGYDAMGNQTSSARTRTRLDGATSVEMVSEAEYDVKGRVIKQYHKVDGIVVDTTEIVYNSLGKQASVTTHAGTVQYTYDARGYLSRATYPDGSCETYAYDREGNRTLSVDRDGRVSKTDYDDLNRTWKTYASTDGAEPTTVVGRTEYDAIGRAVGQYGERDVQLAETVYADLPEGRSQVTTIQLPNSAEPTSVINEYDPLGNLIKTTDARGKVTEYIYDNNNRLERVVYPDSSETTYEYDKIGRRTAQVDQAGRRTEYEYDSLGRLARVIDDLQGETEYFYDEVGNLIRQIDANDRETRMDYDGRGRLVYRELPGTQKETFEYADVDETLNSDLFVVPGPRYIKSTRQHCNFNEMDKADDEREPIVYDYDGDGRLIRKTLPVEDEPAREIVFDYTPGGLLVQAGGDTFDYDARGRVTHHLVQRYYDSQNQEYDVAYIYDDDTASPDDAYSRTVRVNKPGGGYDTEVVYGYNDLGQLVKVTSGADVTRYEYNANGNLESVTYPNGNKAAYVYDDLNRLTSVEYRRSDDSLLSSYVYTLGPAGNREFAVETLAGGSGPVVRKVDYAYDELYRLTGETVLDGDNNVQRVVEYACDAVGNRLSMRVRTASTSEDVLYKYHYDANDRLTYVEKQTQGLAWADDADRALHAAAGPRPSPPSVWSGRLLAGLGAVGMALLCVPAMLIRSTGLGRRGRRRRLFDASICLLLALLMAVGPVNVQALSHEAMLYRSLAPAALGEITVDVSYLYDANGNLIGETRDGQTVTHTYDAENKLIASKLAASEDNFTELTYRYDADGIRIGKSRQVTTGGVAGAVDSVFYIVDKQQPFAQVIEERDGDDGSLLVSYVHGLDLIAQTRGATTSYYHADGQLSTRLLTDSDGAATDTYTYDAFGDLLPGGTGSTDNSYFVVPEKHKKPTYYCCCDILCLV